MIDGSKIKKARKAKGLSQQQLAEGITVQGTISALERNSTTPSSSILAEIISRLDLTLDEIIIGDSTFSILQKLNKADQYCMTYEYDKVLKTLKDVENHIEKEHYNHFQFLKANAQMWLTEDYDTAIFNYNKLLQRPHFSLDIYSVLATCELGVAYAKKEAPEKANYYFSQLPELMDQIDLDKYIFWTLFLYDNLSKFYSNTNQTKLCFQTLDKAIQFTKTHSCTYFLDHYYFLYATETRNNQDGWNEKSIDYLIQAHVFAKYLENDTILELTTKYLVELIPSFNWN